VCIQKTLNRIFSGEFGSRILGLVLLNVVHLPAIMPHLALFHSHMKASQTGTDRASMPEEKSEEPPTVRSKLTLPAQRQQNVLVNSPFRHFACAAAFLPCAAVR
jgi:hypothetical protein